MCGGEGVFDSGVASGNDSLEKVRFHGKSWSSERRQQALIKQNTSSGSNKKGQDQQRVISHVTEQVIQEKSKRSWWLCVEYLQDRDVYAIGGYLQNFEQDLLGILVNFKQTDSLGAAFDEALVEAIQCALEEFGCIESDMLIETTSSEINN